MPLPPFLKFHVLPINSLNQKAHTIVPLIINRSPQHLLKIQDRIQLSEDCQIHPSFQLPMVHISFHRIFRPRLFNKLQVLILPKVITDQCFWLRIRFQRSVRNRHRYQFQTPMVSCNFFRSQPALSILLMLYRICRKTFQAIFKRQFWAHFLRTNNRFNYNL